MNEPQGHKLSRMQGPTVLYLSINSVGEVPMVGEIGNMESSGAYFNVRVKNSIFASLITSDLDVKDIQTRKHGRTCTADPDLKTRLL